MKYLVDVNADRIARGQRNNRDNCPVAIATNETTGYTCEVDSMRLRLVLDDGEIRKVRVPVTIGRAMSGWDFGGPMAPFAFELDLGAEPGQEKMTLL